MLTRRTGSLGVLVISLMFLAATSAVYGQAAPAAAPAAGDAAAPAAPAAPAAAPAPAAGDAATPAAPAAPAAGAAPAAAAGAAPAAPAAPAAGDAAAMPAGTGPEGKKPLDLWGDFVHYIKIARPDIAKLFGEALVKANVDPREMYAMALGTTDSQAVLARAWTSSKDLQPIIDEIRKKIEEGYRAERGDPKEIARAIGMLVENERARILAVERLRASGEYALPQLVQKLSDPSTAVDLKARIVALLPLMGREAVRGMATALQTNDSKLQQTLVGALNQLEYPHAAPALRELLDRKDIQAETAELAKAALVTCAGSMGKGILKKSSAELFYDLGEKYYYRADSLRPDARFATANVWYWQEGLGLTFKAVPTQVFYDIYAMRCARMALQHDPTFYPAVSLWLAAYVARETDSAAAGAAASQPAGDGEILPPRFYVLASSARFQQDLLVRALKDKNSTLAVRAIDTLVQTAGAKSLVEPLPGGVNPLVEAMNFPDRLIRFMAAEALAQALPDKAFSGSQFVMPTLVEALRQNGKKVAVLMAADTNQKNELKDMLRGAGYEVLEASNLINDAMSMARNSAGVDVFVVGNSPDGGDVVRALRKDLIFSAMPVIVFGQAADLRPFAAKDGRMVLLEATAKADALKDALRQAADLGVGKPFSPEQANEWVVRAADAVRVIGLTHNATYDIKLARKALCDALNSTDAKVQVAAAKALAVSNEAEAQQAIVALAVKSAGDEKVRIDVFDAATESARKFGNQLTPELAQAVLEIVTTKGSEPLKVAAAKLLGSLNLPSDKVKDLVVTAGCNE